MQKRKKISIVIPVYNEAQNIPLIYQEVVALRAREPAYDFEILVMDNHSEDESFQVAAALAQQDSQVRVIRLSRNFGYQANILTGYLNATGDAAVQLDADGEDDPAMISQFMREWEAGYKVIYGVRTQRQEGWLIQFQRRLFYKLIARLSPVKLPEDAGDFRLLDRQVLDSIHQFREASIYLRGMFSYIGFKQKGLPYKRRKRFYGESKFRWSGYLSLAIDGITSFSRKPLFYVAYLGFALSIASFVAGLFYLAMYFTVGVEARGFTTLILVQLFLTGVQLVCLGLTGVYVGRIFDEVKGRPRSLIEVAVPPLPAPLGA